MRYFLALVAFAAMLSTGWAAAAPRDDVEARFQQFVAAQNAHDLANVRSMLADGPAFVWVTRGVVVQGADAATDRFRSLYQGTWRLTPTGAPQVFVIDAHTVQLVAPVTFSIGPANGPATDSTFLLTQLWRRTGHDWRIVSLLPIPTNASSH